MPQNWKTYKLEEIAVIKYGKDHKKLEEGSYPCYGTGGIMRYVDKYLFNEESVLIPRKGSLNNIYYINEPFWTVDTLFWTKVNSEKIIPKYLYYNFKTIDFASKDVGSAVPSLTTSLLNEIEVCIPPLPEQKAIASILSALDDKIELNLQQNKTLEEMAMALYKHWFVDFGPFQDGDFVESELGMIPEGWEVKRLDEISMLLAGGDKPKNYSKELNENLKIPIYSNGISNEGLYGYTDIARIKKESITVSARGTIGFVCLRMQPYLPIVRLISIVPNREHISSKFLFLCLKTLNIQGTGTTQQQLTVPDFKETKIVIPNIELVNEFTEIMDSTYENIVSNKAENQTLTKLRDTLLPKLISGEVRVKDVKKTLSEIL